MAIKKTVTLITDINDRELYLIDLGDETILQGVSEVSPELELTRTEKRMIKLCQRIMDLEEKCQNL